MDAPRTRRDQKNGEEAKGGSLLRGAPSASPLGEPDMLMSILACMGENHLYFDLLTGFELNWNFKVSVALLPIELGVETLVAMMR